MLRAAVAEQKAKSGQAHAATCTCSPHLQPQPCARRPAGVQPAIPAGKAIQAARGGDTQQRGQAQLAACINGVVLQQAQVRV